MACQGPTKIILTVFNGLLFLIGLVPLIFGAVALANSQILDKILSWIPGGEVATELIKNSAIYLLVVGIVVCVVAGLGLFGACRANKCFLYLYLVTLLVIIGAEIVVLVLVLAFPETFNTEAQKVMRETLKGISDCELKLDSAGQFYDCENNNADPVKLAWHVMQYELKCCGAKDFTDYNTSGAGGVEWTNRRSPDSLAPLTCCVRSTEISTSFPPKEGDLPSGSSCYTSSTEASQYYTQGCLAAVMSWVTMSATVIGVLAGIGVLELILVTSTFVQICRDRKKKQ